MNQSERKKAKASVPMYTKVGWVVAWAVMVVILSMILRNCATSIFYGSRTEPQAVDSSYKLGLEDGKAGQGPHLRGEAVGNPVLRKAYNKGYRDGIDRSRQQGGGGSGS